MERKTQSERVLARLRQGPATTWQLGYELGICSVTRRISDLRERGFEIEMTQQYRGKTRICTYTLKGQLSLPLKDVA